MANFRYSNRKLESPVAASLNTLKEAATFHDGVIVAYSGGKDSLVVMDLACKSFRRVVGVLWYMFPGLKRNQDAIDYAKTRWGVEVLTYPDPMLIESARAGHYRPEPSKWLQQFPKSDLATVQAMARQDSGLKLILTGQRQSDFNKRKMAHRVGKSTKILHPISRWSKYDVLAYLKRNDISIPDSHRDAGGIDLTAPSLLYMHDHYPDDFQKVLRYFPLAQAVVKRREFHGV